MFEQCRVNLTLFCSAGGTDIVVICSVFAPVAAVVLTLPSASIYRADLSLGGVLALFLLGRLKIDC